MSFPLDPGPAGWRSRQPTGCDPAHLDNLVGGDHAERKHWHTSGSEPSSNSDGNQDELLCPTPAHAVLEHTGGSHQERSSSAWVLTDR